MKAKIARVILWPKKEGVSPSHRIVDFAMRGVEVVTGGSQRGKSALIPIIDYCLGSEECRIPIGRIRDAVGWFGTELHFEGKYRLLLCRRNPEGQEGTDEMRIAEGMQIAAAALPTTPISRREVINGLNLRAGLPEIGMSPDSDAPSFRDMVAFNFQPQHIVANPTTLFYLSDFHKAERIEEVFPLVLGAETLPMIELKHKARLRRDEREKEQAKLNVALAGSRIWLPRLKAHFLKFQQLGYIPSTYELEDSWTVATLVSHLKPVPNQIALARPSTPKGGGRKLAKRISDLRRQAEHLEQEVQSLQRRMEKVEGFKALTDDYRTALQNQRDRLQPTHWFSQRLKSERACPFCGNENGKVKKQIADLVAASQHVEQSLVTVDRTPTVVSEELLELEREEQARQTELEEVMELLERLVSEKEEFRSEQKSLEERREAGGELRAILETVETADESGKLNQRIVDLTKEIEALEQQIDHEEIRANLRARLGEIASRIAHYANIIGVEHSGRHPRLDPKRLTVKFSGAHGRDDFLWEIGSAANWMGYHVAALLALHEVLRALPTPSPVPQFIIFDQPSQPYFPEKGLKSEDLRRVRRIFEALSDFCTRTESGVQVIVIEHAGEGAWQGIKHVHKKHEWRDEGKALIPDSWS
jgi:hypothetical protein